MSKMIIISEEDLRNLVTEVVDNLTKKIAARSASRHYKNELFNRSKPVVVESGCGSSYDDGGCGSSSRRSSRSYGCGSSYGGGGGCGSSHSSGGC